MTTQSSTKHKRLAPSLFVPPSRNVSTTDLHSETPYTSVPAQTPTTARVPLLHQRSTLKNTSVDSTTTTNPSQTPQDASNSYTPPSQPPQQPQQRRRPSNRQPSSTSQTWAELQNTLEEVELSAASGASDVFGAEHARALEDLRAAQVELARAWARSEEGERDDDAAALGDDIPLHESSHPRSPAVRDTTAVLAADRGRKLGGVAGAGDADAGTGGPGRSAFGINKTQLEEETENDMLLARERRLANDRYFEKVNKGVLDVVAKLEVVANRMGAVELESQDIWSDRSSGDSDSVGQGT